jgi:hypothetical protein
MNNEQIQQIKQFSYWAKEALNKSVNFSINFWSYSFDAEETTCYRIWISETISKEFDTLENLVHELPKLKTFCLMKKELSL